MGYDVYMDGNGDAEGNYSLVALSHGEDDGKEKLFLY